MTKAIILCALALGVLTVSAWMHIRNKDGSGWGFVALLLVMSACDAAKGLP
jgi:hypothetical protein